MIIMYNIGIIVMYNIGNKELTEEGWPPLFLLLVVLFIIYS